MIVSSDSEPLPRKKFRRVIRKVRFSHPLEKLDPHFLLKQQQHESRRQTRNSRGEELSSGLPNTPAPRKRQNKILFLTCSFNLLARLIAYHLTLLRTIDQELAHSSSGASLQTELPAFKTSPGQWQLILLCSYLCSYIYTDLS